MSQSGAKASWNWCHKFLWNWHPGYYISNDTMLLPVTESTVLNNKRNIWFASSPALSRFLSPFLNLIPSMEWNQLRCVMNLWKHEQSPAHVLCKTIVWPAVHKPNIPGRQISNFSPEWFSNWSLPRESEYVRCVV